LGDEVLKMKGYTGKILRLDLSNRKISTIGTKDYEEWGGGHGMGSAIFFDLVRDKAISAFDPRNVVTIMTSPLTGTLAPSTGRTEVQGIGAQPYPTEWFTRSNFGGRFGAMLKYGGWDGIVIEGKADKPVWVDIRNDQVRIRDARSLWGLDTWETQKEIWREVGGRVKYGDWTNLVSNEDERRTTQRPAVLTIGPAGENLSRIAALIHDAGSAAGQGGFGGVWGSKNLKAISVIGTDSVQVADPNALMEARSWIIKNYSYNVDHPVKQSPKDNFHLYGILTGSPGYGPLFLPLTEPSRPQGCLSCPRPCRRRTKSSASNESQCAESFAYMAESPNKTLQATDLMQKTGINAFEILNLHGYLRDLYKMGVLGPRKEIEGDLPFDKYGKLEFGEALINAIAHRRGIGNDLAEGTFRAAKKWGRLEKDLQTGLLRSAGWGCWEHYDPRLEVEWSYGSILGDRDINEHCLNAPVHWMPTVTALVGEKPFVFAEKLVEIIAKKLGPYNDPAMLDYSVDGIYSEGKVKMTAWHRHYTRFWKQSVLYCDWVFPDFLNVNASDMVGFTPEAEPKFFNAVTGKKMTFEEGMQLGRKIWNLDRAVWVLQGRHRDQEVFAEYVYKQPTREIYLGLGPYYLPIKENGKWVYGNNAGRVLDRDRFEEWKTKYYKFEGWDPNTGWPTEKNLESLGLRQVADELKQRTS